MPRPCKKRKINAEFNFTCFRPEDVPESDLREVRLDICEVEAIRLAVLKGMYQVEAAKEMEVSRQTFGNILNSAHKKVADALINGKTIKIEKIIDLKH